MFHNNHSRTFFRWFWILLVMYIIAGLLCGFIFPKEIETSSLYYSTHEETKFNWMLMIGVWVSSIIPEVIIYGIYSHLENQEIQIKALDNIYTAVNKIDLHPKSNDTHENSYRNPAAAGNTTWVCSRCGTINKSYDERCTNCDNKKGQ